MVRGGTGSFTLAVTNSGGTATDGTTVTATDTVPTGLTPTAATGTGWSCSIASQTVTCTRSDVLAGGASYPDITISVDVASNAAASITNTGSVNGGGDGSAATGDTTIATVAPAAPVDLTLTKTASAATMVRGGTGSFTLAVTNNGGTATDGTTVTVTDTVPTGLTPTAAAGTGWSCSIEERTVDCARNDVLAVADSYPTITITVDVASGAAASLTNTASVSGGGDTTPATDSATVGTVAPAPVDLTITKTASPSTLVRGGTGSFALAVTNAGSTVTDGTTVAVTDTVPTGLTPTAASGAGWTCSIASQTVTCTRSDVLTAGDGYPDITVDVDVTQVAEASVTNTASVSGGGDTTPASDSATVAITGEPVDLALTKTHSGSFQQGTQGSTYTLVVANAGSAPSAGQVTVTDVVPAGLTPVNADGAGWTCSIAGETVDCTRGDALAPGASYPPVTLTVDVASDAPLQITNTASVNGGGDATPANNAATDIADIAEVSGRITFDKTHVGTFVKGQLEAQFVLLVSNTGTGPAVGSTRIVDDVPDALPVRRAGGDGWTCDISGQVVTCTRNDDLPAGASFPPLTITVFVPPDAPDSIVNSATLNGTIVDDDIVAFTDPVDVDDPEPVDLTVTKVVDKPVLQIGDEPVFTLGLRNPTGLVLGAVTLHDTLPPGFIYVPGSATMTVTGPRIEDLTTGASGTPVTTTTTPIEPTIVDGQLVFLVGDLPPGAHVEVVYTTVVGATVRPGEFGTVVTGSGTSPGGELVTTVPLEVDVLVVDSSFSLTQLLIGRVFEDTNRNGSYDPEEPGIGNVRVVTASGLSATTDEQGQYNLPSLAAGSTLVAVDPSTIPDGFSLPDGERSLDGGAQLLRTPLQGGSLLRQNFGLVPSGTSAARRDVSRPRATEPAPVDDESGEPAATLRIELERPSMQAGGRDTQRITVRALDSAGAPASATSLLLTTTLGMLSPADPSRDDGCSADIALEEQPALFNQAELVTRSGVASACLTSGAMPGDAGLEVVDLENDTLIESAVVAFDVTSRAPILVALGEVGVGLSSPASGATADAQRVDGQATLFYQDSLAADDLLTVALRTKENVNRATGGSGLFEQDPLDRVYPVMGDASTRMALAQSNSHLFARYDRGRSYALFGDLRADRASATRSGLLEFSRNVTGFRVHLESQESSNWFQGQVSRPRTAYAREVVTALVGSAIRLAHPRVIPGSEVVTVEVRDRRNPERTLSRETLARNIDYILEIDSGFLQLKRRLPMFEQTLALVDVVVTYEYETSGLDSTVYLTRGSVALDAIGLTLGGSVMVQNEAGKRFGVGGVEVEQALFGAGVFRAAVPISRGELPQDAFGTTPGACCDPRRGRDGTAVRMELEQPFVDRRVVVRGSYASTDDDFLNPYGEMTVPGQRFGSGSVDTQLADATRLRVGFEAEANENGLVDNTRQTVGAQVEHRVTDTLAARAGLDGRWFDDNRTTETVTSRLLSAGLDWSPVERLRTSVTREHNLSDEADPTYPDQTTLGAQLTMTPGNELYVTQRFSSAPIVPISGVEAGGLSSSPLSTRETAIGVASRLGRYTTLNNRYALESSINGTDSFAVLGLLTSIPVRKGLSLDWSLDHGLHLAGPDKNYVGGALGVVYSKDEDLRTTARYELRRRAVSEHIVNLGAVGRLTSDISMLARYRLADIATTGRGRLSDGQVAVAVRPRQSDRVALLLSYEQGRSRGAELLGVSTGRTDQLSMDGYLLVRRGLESYTRLSALRVPTGGDDSRGNATFFQTRLQQRVTSRFDIAGEIRLVKEVSQPQWHDIVAAEIGAWLSRDLRVGVGYSSRGFANPGSLLDATASRGGTYLVLSSRLSALFDLMGRTN